jgi:hypothetical protein
MTTGGRQDLGGGPPDGDDLVDLLYGELPPDEERAIRARVAGDPNLSAQLSELERVREMVRALPDEEPPPAISAQLLAHAAQAAQRRGGTAPVVAPGFWSRLRSWFQPIIAHPGLAAACSVVLVAGVAGVLILRQGDELTSATRSAEPEPEADLRSATDRNEIGPGASAAAPPAAESAPTGAAGGAASAGEGDEAPAEAPADEPSGVLPSDKTRTARRPRAYRLPDGKDSRRQDDGAKQDAPGPKGGALGMTDEKAPRPSDDADESGAAAGRAEEAEQQQGAEAPAEPAPPPAAAPAAPQPSQTTADPSSGEARALHEQAVKAAAARRCLEVQSLDEKIRSLDPAYHERSVLRDKRLAVCLSANKPAKARRK